MSGVTGHAQGRLGHSSTSSAPVNTAITPGVATAPETSIDLMRAWASGLRTKAIVSMPAAVMLSVQFVWPVMRWASSLRRGAVPMVPAVGSSMTVMRAPLPFMLPAAMRTAFTMFW